MTSLTIISALLGVWLGLTFRVFILVPAAILALATLAGSGAASDAGAMWMVVLDISVIAAMQAGYLGGSALFVAVRTDRSLCRRGAEGTRSRHCQRSRLSALSRYAATREAAMAAFAKSWRRE
jgi:hypothetical protein